MAKLTLAQKQAVTRLAVAYNAFYDAQAAKNWNGVIVYAEMIQTAQAVLGFEMMPNGDLITAIAYAKQKEDNPHG